MQKHLIALATGVGALALSTVAFAGNTVDLTQDGDNNTATANQIGDSNWLAIVQTGTAGAANPTIPGRTANVKQQGYGNFGDISQSTGLSLVDVRSTGNQNAVQSAQTTSNGYLGNIFYVRQDGNLNSVGNSQDGASWAYISQKNGDGNGFANEQFGKENRLGSNLSSGMVQDGSGNWAHNSQIGTGNQLGAGGIAPPTLQQGNNNSLENVQRGDSNYADLSQIGNLNIINNTQTVGNNILYVRQAENGNIVGSQQGDAAWAYVTQTGTNTFLNEQYGGENRVGYNLASGLIQTGYGNYAESSQIGSFLVMVNTSQNGNDNWLSNTQRGSYNTLTVTQDGNGNSAYGAQTGTGSLGHENTMTVTQLGNGNVATWSQSGVGTNVGVITQNSH